MKTYNELQLAQELIRFPTVKTEDKGIMKFLSKKLSSIGFRCKIIKSKGIGAKPASNLYVVLIYLILHTNLKQVLALFL